MHAVIIVGLIGAAGIAALFITHKLTLAGIKAEVAALEAKALAVKSTVAADAAIAVSDVKAFIAAVRAKL